MSDTALKHAKVTTTTPRPGGGYDIDTKSYFEELKSVKQEIQQTVKTSKDTLLTDVIKSLSVLTSDATHELTLTIKAEAKGMKLIKTWTVKKEYY